MKIIRKQPNQSGAYPPIQTWPKDTPPDTHYEIICDTSVFYNGFITPTVEGEKVTSFTCNTEAWEAWKTEMEARQAERPPTETESLRGLLALANKVIAGEATVAEYQAAESAVDERLTVKLESKLEIADKRS